MTGRDIPDILPDSATSELELVPVNDFATLTFADMQPQVASSSGGPALAGLLEDVLFGEVIDISELIPSVLSHLVEVSPPVVSGTEQIVLAELGPPEGTESLLATDHGVAMSILYDDNILDASGTIL